MNKRSEAPVSKAQQTKVIRELIDNKMALLKKPSNYKEILEKAGKAVTLDEAATMFHAVHIVTRLLPKHHQEKAGDGAGACTHVCIHMHMRVCVSLASMIKSMIPVGVGTGVLYECGCVWFHEKFVCKHVLALALMKKETKVRCDLYMTCD